jgi:hypothetical protein
VAKVKTLVDFHDKTQIDARTGFPKLVPAGTVIEVSAERHAVLAARRIVPSELPVEAPLPADKPAK